MNPDRALDLIRLHEAELRQLGVVRLALFGSTARGDAGPHSDIDVVVTLDAGITGLRAFGCLDRVKERLALLLNAPVDVVPEPASSSPLQAAIDKDRRLAFA